MEPQRETIRGDMMTPTTPTRVLTAVFLLQFACSKADQESSDSKRDLEPTFVTTPENGQKESGSVSEWRANYRRPAVIDMHTHVGADVTY